MDKISPTLNCQNIIKSRKENNLPVYNFGLGANCISQPDFYIQKVQEYAGKKNYTSVQGISELQDSIINNFSTETYAIDNVLIGNGLKELLYIIQLSFVGKIYHITPSWVSYKEQIRILNKECDLIEIETNLKNNYKINLNDLETSLKKYKNDKKLILFNNPNNPTGTFHNPEEVKLIANLLNKYNCIVLADEIYMNLTHFNKIETISTYIPHLTIRSSSVSKDLGCGGYRLGWLTFPKELKNLYKKCSANASSIYSCTSTPIQYATSSMLNNKSLFTKHCNYNNKVYKHIVCNLCKILDKSKIKFVKPTSAWYIFANFSNYKKSLENLGVTNSYELNSLFLNKIGIISVPGECFNISGLNLRFSLIDIDTDNIFLINELINTTCYSKMIEGFTKLINFLNNIQKYN
jgi:aspartate aminotransferase|tara:strand:- start:10416 stop:11636 length:1221 start_codon:yes stop_codon:yes gene_type:complete